MELAQPLTPALALAYGAIGKLMDACVRELRKSNRLDTTDLTVDRGLCKSFDEIVRRQLKPLWHTLPPKTRQIVADLRTLRLLAGYMLRFDAVTFLRYLETLRATEGTKSVWLFHSGRGRGGSRRGGGWRSFHCRSEGAVPAVAVGRQ